MYCCTLLPYTVAQCDNPDDVTIVFNFYYRVDDRESGVVILLLPYLINETFQFSSIHKGSFSFHNS